MKGILIFLMGVGLFVLIPSVEALSPSQVDDWAYQLQNYINGLNDIRSSRYDLVVIDYSSTGDESGEWTASEIRDLRAGGPCGDRIVLAYMSIGEAENYRFYWDPSWVDASGEPIPGVAPDWLGPENPDWEGNYKVRYWNSGWQNIIFGTSSGPDKSYLDRILDQGFDGVYLDIIDAFEYWGPSEIGGTDENRWAARDMIDFVEAISDYAHTHGHPDFFIFPQNGSYIIDPDCYPDASDPSAEAETQKNRYFSKIDGIGIEDIFFVGSADENNPYNPDTDRIALVNEFRDAGKIVISIEYLTDNSLISDYYDTYASAQNYIPYASIRALDQLTINTGYEPDCESPILPSLSPFGVLLLSIGISVFILRRHN